jgi:hypothetical protein
MARRPNQKPVRYVQRPFRELRLKTRKRKSAALAESQLVPGRDYYLEGTRMIFTAEFLRRRGFCCESGCRHCPYGFGPEGLRRRLAALEHDSTHTKAHGK